MSEKFDSNMYRKGLAQSLVEIRNSGAEGHKKARLFLDIAKETDLYQASDAERRAEMQANHKDPEISATQNTTEQAGETIKSREAHEAAMVHELLDLISSNKDFTLGIAASGELFPKQGKGPSIGHWGYLFNQQKQMLVGQGHTPESGLNPIVYHGKGRDTETLYKPFLRWDAVESGDAQFIKYQGWINWKNTQKNPFTYETRGALSFSGSLSIRRTTEAAQAVSAELFQVIRNSNSPETHAIMWKFFVAAFQKYVPEYWEFIESMWQMQPENKGKEIKNHFG